MEKKDDVKVEEFLAPSVVPFEVRLNLLGQGSSSSVEIRQVFKDSIEKKALINAAWDEAFVVIRPRFKNKLIAINALIEKKIIEKNDSGEFVYVI